MLPKTMRINNKNHLEFGGCDLVEIAEKYGTPLYVMDESMIRENCRSYLQALKSHYQGKGEIAYAAKAFLTLAMARLVQEEGLGMDVVSGGELFCALKAGFDPSRLFFHGNNKSKEELISGLKAGVGRFVVDSFSELDALSVLAQEMKTTAHILLRVKPGIEAHTHEYIKTGQEDSKFGFGLERDGVLAAVKKALTMKGIALKGLHCHIGSQILDPTPFAPTAAIMMELLQRIREVFGIVLEDLDLGGGMGIRYEKEDEPVPIKEFVALVSQAVQQEAKKYNYPLPRLILEPGRSIVGEAGITLYRVGVIKNIPGIRKYVSVDGGMMDNIRPALYRAKYSAVLA
ncbi:MAG: diaminopimelate decarboxylase, partial [Firmicutes bacterium]|nr:diaminopimelate decarboxylase [Bacillota bacterium]